MASQRIASFEAFGLGRFARACELLQRALAVADATLPRDSLVIACLLDDIKKSRRGCAATVCMNSGASSQQQFRDRLTAALHADALLLAASQRCLALLHARWRAGTLLAAHTAQERAYFEACVDAREPVPHALIGAQMYIDRAEEALATWPRLAAPAEEAARLAGVHGALQATLALHARGLLAPARDDRHGTVEVKTFLEHALDEESALPQLRTAGLLATEEAVLQSLLEARRNDVPQRTLAQATVEFTQQARRTAQLSAADVARHGLRRCALPSCAAQEPHPKLFKLCGRCHAAAYCCKQHQTEDWKRHKREDSCAASP
jgi:hypothetical protein